MSLHKLRRFLYGLILFGIALQTTFHLEEYNMLCTGIAALTSVLAVHFLLQEPIPKLCPFSSMQILVFSLGNTLLPMVVLPFNGKPLNWNLDVAPLTFSNIAVVTITLLIVHVFYRRTAAFTDIKARLRNGIFRRIGAFSQLKTAQLWMMGSVGMVALAVIAFYHKQERGPAVAESPLTKVVEYFMPFAYAPFLALTPKLFGSARRPSSLTYATLGAYGAGIVLLAVARNARIIFAYPVISLAFVTLMGLIAGRIKLKIAPHIIIIFLPLAWLAVKTGSDLALSMQIAREKRIELSAGELMSLTLQIFLDKQQLAEFRANTLEEKTVSDWSELYMTNPFLGRFVSVKYIDNVIALAGLLNDNDSVMLRADLQNKVIGLLPQPLINIMGIPLDKMTVITYSTGDAMYYLKTGQGLGGFRTGSYIGQGLAIFGWFYPFFLALIALPIFVVIDCFAFPLIAEVSSNPAGAASGRYSITTFFSPLGFLMATEIGIFYNADSFSYMIIELIRGFPQAMVLYAIMVGVTGIFAALFP